MTKTNKQIENELLAKITKYEKDNIKPLKEAVAKATKKESAEIKKRIKLLEKDPTYKEDIKNHKEKVRQNKNPDIANRKTNLFVSNTDDQIYREQTGETQADRESLIELLKSVYTVQHKATLEEDIIYLFLTYFKCYKNNVDITGGEVNGYTYRDENSCIMFVKNPSATSQRIYRDMPHEAIHALGIDHTFNLTAQHTFTQGTTDNHMDYATTAYHTFVWQWRLLHESKLTK